MHAPPRDLEAHAKRRAPRLLICTGEASGDALAAALTSYLRRDYPGIQIWGMGGQALREESIFTVAQTDDLGVVGIMEALPAIAKSFQLRSRFQETLSTWRPDLVLTVDSPTLMLRLCRSAKRMGVPAVQLVSPQVWAWRPGRVTQVNSSTDRVLCLFPHEPAFFNRMGGDAHWVGHPAVMRPPREPVAAASGPAVFGLAPGSRRAEINRLWPVFCRVAREIRLSIPSAEFVVARAPGHDLRDFRGIPGLRIGGSEDLYSTSAVLACSGTVTLEVSLSGTPLVSVYRLSSLSHAVASRLVTGIQHFSLPNILLGEAVVTEHLQNLSPRRIAADLVAVSKAPEEALKIATKLRARLNNGDPLTNTSEALSPWLSAGQGRQS
jgi:lipid-A-disaccharide synthase